ncbi:MAG: oxygen-independent coproporphyrinogen III oxidase [Bacteroidetes bacterium]|nr:oxygen-independent coproporphyrinogen III oxidase [Bacteroidota bacterium]
MNLVSKYNVQAPRYTSYPTVPYWDKTKPDVEEWKRLVKFSFDKSNEADGISIYIHLPFCESLCTYCGCNTRITVNHAVEDVYINYVLKEWSLYLSVLGDKPNIKEIHLGGGTPTFFSAENLKKLITGILENASLTKDAELSFEAHPNNTHLCHLKTMYDLGFRRISLGIQDFDPKVQEIINRVQPFEIVESVVNMARNIGYSSVNFDLVYGLPLQTKESVVNTINQVMLLKPDRIAFYSYAHVPWIKPGQRKFTEADLPVDNEKKELYETGRSLFKKNGYEDVGMDHFSLKSDTLYKAAISKKLHRNFMGYTHNYSLLMIGLGVSSISDSWYAFAQNAKIVEEYYKLLDENTLPLIKGHKLSSSDLILRKHILNLVCNYKTSWENESEKCSEIHTALDKLVEMEKDGLVEIHPSNVIVTEVGKGFLRNICMAFDARLWSEAPKTQLFSSSV